jgi:hypothetical protein
MLSPHSTAVLEDDYSSADEMINANHIQGLADILIRQCQLARMILNSGNDASREAMLATKARAHIVRDIDDQLATAKQLFPHAESFQDQQHPVRPTA